MHTHTHTHMYSHTCVQCAPYGDCWHTGWPKTATTASKRSHCVLPMRGNSPPPPLPLGCLLSPRNRCDIFRSTSASSSLFALVCVLLRASASVCVWVSWQNKPQMQIALFSFHISSTAIEAPCSKKQPPKNLGGPCVWSMCVHVSEWVSERVSDVCACSMLCKPTQTIRTGLCVYTHAHTCRQAGKASARLHARTHSNTRAYYGILL